MIYISFRIIQQGVHTRFGSADLLCVDPRKYNILGGRATRPELKMQANGRDQSISFFIFVRVALWNNGNNPRIEQVPTLASSLKVAFCDY